MQEQIDRLNLKIDALQGAVDQLNSRVSDTLTELKLQLASRAPVSIPVTEEALHRQPVFTERMTQPSHKDILADSHYIDMDSSYAEGSLSPEVQAQRLTAQLTAAYNRIAALEEQLLDCRINS